MNVTTRFFVLSAFVLLMTATAHAHCEIPCGIYGDEMRIQMLNEHITTIEKSMTRIMAIAKEEDPNQNQLIRWVMNKEKHAEDFQHIVSQYFMTQRIKPGSNAYHEKLELLHNMLVLSMKCKQTTDLSLVPELKTVVKKFSDLYFKKK